jgi:LysM repeat protein
MTPHGPAATAGTMANPTNVYRGAPQPAPPVAQAAAPPPPAPPVEEPLGEPGGTGVEPNTVTVKPGDTLSSIAADQLGDPRRAWQIAQANDLRNPNRISPGMTLRLPTAAADMPSPRPRPATPPSPGSPPVGDYFSGFLGGEPPFSGGAGAKASPGAVPLPRERPYRDPGALGSDPATQERMRQDLERLRSQRSNVEGGGTNVAALSANDNGLPGVPAMTNPSKPLPVPFSPNRMQDWLRRGIIPLPRPGNQAATDYYGQFA